MKKEMVKKLKEVGFSYKCKRMNLKVKKCSGICKWIGLMFHRRQKANALLFDFKKEVNEPIHSFFVFFSFVAVWFDGKGNIIEVRRVKPFRFYIIPRENFMKLIEIPINKRHSKIVKRLLS